MNKAELQALAINQEAPFQARIHALYALDGRGELVVADAIRAFADPHPAVRLHALRLGERWFDTHPASLRVALAGAKSESDPSVLLQLALSLGESKSPEAVKVLAELASTKNSIRWMENAVLASALGQQHGRDTLVAAARMRRQGLQAEGIQTRHYQTNTLLTLIDVEHLQGRTMLQVAHQQQDDERPVLVHTGVYSDDYELTDSGWLISRRYIKIDHL